MKYFELDKKEKQIERDLENGEFVSVKDEARLKKLHQQYARETLNKKININIRLSKKVLQKLRAKALEEGLPYQTLAASILHRYANNVVHI